MIVKIEFKGGDEVLKYIKDLPQQKAKEIIKEATQKAYETTKELAKPHHKSGRLEANIRHRYKDFKGIVWIDDDGMMVEHRGKRVNYATFVLYGTKPHHITPKKKKSLRFTIHDFIFAKSVKHPGYKGDNFLEKALQKTIKALDRL